MKKEKIIILMLSILILFTDMNVYAHPGRTDSRGCHTCRTNCEKWGLSYGQYHCHSGSSSTSPSRSNPTGTTYIKNSDATLSSVKVDGTNITIDNVMNYTTTNKNPKIVAMPTSKKSTVEIMNNENLTHGINQIIIKVTAENSNTKQYKLNINIVNSDATLKSIKINNKNIEISDIMNYTTTDDIIKLDVSACDIYAKIQNKQIYNLELGNNEITIDVQAEDNKTTKKYTLNVVRERIISDNTDIAMYINNSKVIFNNYESNTIYLSSKTTELNIKYELADKNAKIDLDYDKFIKTGNKKIKFAVIAENGKRQEYIVNIHKNSKLEEILHTLLKLGIIIATIFCIYILIKKGQHRKLFQNKK